MVRLVFRPYTQVRRSICTSESLRASTRVSPGFALLGHSSPSFGSQRARYGSIRGPRGGDTDGGRCGAPRSQRARPEDGGTRCGRSEGSPSRSTSLSFRAADCTPSVALARKLDSLVRVSRRGKESAGSFVGGERGRAVRRPIARAPRASPRIRFERPGEPGRPTVGGCGEQAEGALPSDAGRREAALDPPRFLRFPFSNFRLFPLSFQSSLHLSLTVLVRYRSPAAIRALDGIYRPFGLQSQATRLPS
jgi:hypothetical protein